MSHFLILASLPAVQLFILWTGLNFYDAQATDWKWKICLASPPKYHYFSTQHKQPAVFLPLWYLYTLIGRVSPLYQFLSALPSEKKPAKSVIERERYLTCLVL